KSCLNVLYFIKILHFTYLAFATNLTPTSRHLHYDIIYLIFDHNAKLNCLCILSTLLAVYYNNALVFCPTQDYLTVLEQLEFILIKRKKTSTFFLTEEPTAANSKYPRIISNTFLFTLNAFQNAIFLAEHIIPASHVYCLYQLYYNS